MTQTVLNFTIEGTDEKLTPRSGEVLFGEYLKAIGVDKLCDCHLPLPQSNRGYAPFAFLQPLLLMLHSGGKSLEDIRVIREDHAMRALLHIKKVPTASTMGKWLKRWGLIGIYGMERINKQLLKRHLKRVDEPLVLDIDASVIESHKSEADYTYKMVPGYTPMIGHINGGYVIHSEFRSGNIAPADTNLEFVQHCIEQLPATQRLAYLRADSASYQHRLFDYCDRHGITYTVGGHLDRRVWENIREIKQWRSIKRYEGESHHLQEEIAEFIHTMHESQNAFRMIVVKKKITPMLPAFEAILSEEEALQYAKEHYSVIATNSEADMEDIVRFYRQRGDSSENRIKELKNGFSLKYLPTSDFIANAFYFQIGVLAYNLFILFKETLQKSWRRHTIHTIRYKLYNIAGKVAIHSRQVKLRVNEQFLQMLNAIRQKCYLASLQ